MVSQEEPTLSLADGGCDNVSVCTVIHFLTSKSSVLIGKHKFPCPVLSVMPEWPLCACEGLLSKGTAPSLKDWHWKRPSLLLCKGYGVWGSSAVEALMCQYEVKLHTLYQNHLPTCRGSQHICCHEFVSSPLQLQHDSPSGAETPSSNSSYTSVLLLTLTHTSAVSY